MRAIQSRKRENTAAIQEKKEPLGKGKWEEGMWEEMHSLIAA